MWSMFDWKRQISVVVLLTIVCVLGLQYLFEMASGASPSPIKLVSFVTFLITTVLFTAFNFCWRWVWRKVPALSKLLFPDLNGTWKGHLQTTWKDENGVTPGPIDTVVWIKQNLISVSIEQKTKESTSESTRVIPEREPKNDRFRLWYSYHNKPMANVSHRSAQHEGAGWLEMNVGRDKDRLTGQYYTSRKTNGDLAISRISAEIISESEALSAT